MKPAEEFYLRQEAWSSQQDLEWLLLLESGNRRAQEVELATCSKNLWRFLTHWIQTEDNQNKENPFQLFPNKIHLQVLAEYWLIERFLAVPKTRQVTATWLFSGAYFWESLFFPSRLSFFQSKKETDADANMERVYTMWSRLPKWMREWQPCERTFCNLSFPRSRSEIKGIPQGDDHTRGFTATGFFGDESAFVEGLGKTLAAVRPAIGSSGRITLISSAAPGEFKNICFDQSEA